jgi:hypothetical protein
MRSVARFCDERSKDKQTTVVNRTPDAEWLERAGEAFASGKLGKRLVGAWSDSRENLVIELIRHGVRNMDKVRLFALDDGVERSGGAPLSIEDIVDARLLPVAELVIHSALTNESFHKGITRLFGETPSLKRRVMREAFPESVDRFLFELGRSLPGLCAEEVEERFWMSHASIVGSLGMLDKHYHPEDLVGSEQRMWKQVHLLRDAMCGLFRAPSRPDFHQQMVHCRDGSQQWQVAQDHIASVRADGDYSRVFLSDGQSHYLRRTIKEWVQILPEPQFLQTHRTSVVNLELASGSADTSVLSVPGDPEPVPVSRRNQPRVQKALASLKQLKDGWVER